MKGSLSFSKYFVIGVALFALFFGAGNLIFPATLGQNAGEHLWPALIGFLITGIGLPLLGILAIGVSGSQSLQDLASRIHPVYGVVFTSLLYLTIGPFFATPRTGAVAYEIGIAPFFSKNFNGVGMFVFTLLFFGITMWFSLKPTKIVDLIGKILSPAIIILLIILLAAAFIHPIGSFQAPRESYQAHPFMQGFTEGYNTMDALSSLVFGIIVINAVRSLGVTSTRGILTATIKSGIVAVSFLGIIYIGIAYLGATLTEKYGLFKTGGPILSHAASHYFGMPGTIMLTVIIILACLTTSIGLITACGEYFHTIFPKISYTKLVIFFSLFSFAIANFGLANIINYSLPVLMFLYPLAIVLMLLTFLSPLFQWPQLSFITVTAVTFFISIIDGCKTLCKQLEIPYFNWLSPIVSFYERHLPLYTEGLGWLLPAVIVIVITEIVVRVQKLSPAHADEW